jgi:hypothetical protein
MDPRLQAGVELQLEKQAQQAHNSSLSGVLGQYFKQGAEGKSPMMAKAKKQTEKVRSEYFTDLAKEDQAKKDAGTLEVPPAQRGEVSVQAEREAAKAALAAAKADQAKKDAGTLEVPPAQRGEVSVAAETQAAKAALAAAKEDQARRDAGTLEVPAATDRDRLMKELPPHLQTEPEGGPGNPAWDYWNTMVLLEMQQRRRNPEPRVMQPGDIGHAGNAPAGDFPLPMNIPPGGNPNL